MQIKQDNMMLLINWEVPCKWEGLLLLFWGAISDSCGRDAGLWQVPGTEDMGAGAALSSRPYLAPAPLWLTASLYSHKHCTVPMSILHPSPHSAGI